MLHASASKQRQNSFHFNNSFSVCQNLWNWIHFELSLGSKVSIRKYTIHSKLLMFTKQRAIYLRSWTVYLLILKRNSKNNKLFQIFVICVVLMKKSNNFKVVAAFLVSKYCELFIHLVLIFRKIWRKRFTEVPLKDFPSIFRFSRNRNPETVDLKEKEALSCNLNMNLRNFLFCFIKISNV